MEKTCCFAGHRKIYDNEMKQKISEVIEFIYTEEKVKNFLVGNYGDFDRISARVVSEFKKAHNDIKLEMVIPYLTKDINSNLEYYKMFDNIFIPDIPINTPFKAKIIKTNEYMINNSELLISYINYTWGGAYATYEYAKKKSLNIINLGQYKRSVF
ncbi:MAG: DUF1273 domain-containing protein [Clostridia bacterium]|nr:DUF1273 domain-containing protein [Clostridia bacterium]